MRKISLGQDVPKSVDEVWAVIGDFAEIRKWAPVVKETKTEDSPEGPVRVLTMPDDRVVRETQVDSGPHHYTYTLQRPDMKAYFSTVSVKPAWCIEMTSKLPSTRTARPLLRNDSRAWARPYR